MTPRTAHRTAVVAIGGNALLRGGGHATIAEQFDAARRLAVPLAALAGTGRRLVITHGNGPQVGFIKRRSDLVADLAPELPPLDLDMCVADSQGSIGYILASALGGALPAERVTALVTHTLVDPDDPAFARPTKPIGAFYPQDVARVLAAEHGWSVAEDAGRGWRRVVPSPRPRRVLETEAVRTLSAAGFTVIAGGGGGIPLVRDADGGLRGVEAVIDKDLTSAWLAGELGAELLVITTGVDRVAVDFGRPTQRFLDRLGADEARLLLEAGQFPEGSMGPKIRAALEFLAGGPGREVLITSPEGLAAALGGKGGTRITTEGDTDAAGSGARPDRRRALHGGH
ncbi:carbamate kinase [Streptomyces durmitorensis]|uniref:Carbamate kinase n=1 Tax=Streptomyces durmitorensis TaxID=319947 RepID=A0ABY4Q262_9ACTN|nr:carbamate kinase [Streptomyces durmitorensis]UQT60248.1 carbamate kinase [Streptomyces durmitorensis]